MSRRPAPRPKRGGEEFARNFKSADNATPKKPRFDPRNPSALVADVPEEDAILEADEIGKRGQQTKRNAVNIDGYDSDSSNEGFDGRTERKAKVNKTDGGLKEEEGDDMFAAPDEDAALTEDAEGKKGKKSKDVRFIDVDEVEGQVKSSRSGGHVSGDILLNGTTRSKDVESSSDSDSDVDDEKRAELDSDMDAELGAGGKKKHAPKLDAFNLKAEDEEGGFDEDLNFVRKAADADATHDSWLLGVSKKDIKKARQAQDKRDQERRQKALEDDSILTSDILAELIPLMERSETILEALARLGRGKERKKPKWQTKNKNRRTQEMDVDVNEPSSEDAAETNRRETVEKITGAADRLLTRGQTDIYDAEREMLMRQYKRETGMDWLDISKDKSDHTLPKQWQYRWSDSRDGGNTHGPYNGEMMAAWSQAGYFGEGVEFRRVDDENVQWTQSVEFV